MVSEAKTKADIPNKNIWDVYSSYKRNVCNIIATGENIIDRKGRSELASRKSDMAMFFTP